MTRSLSGTTTPKYLEQAQFQVITAVDGSDGLEKLYSNTCDLVLTDINMGNMDGYEFIRRVRADTAVQIASHHHCFNRKRSKDKNKGFEAGATLYLVKPCSPEIMVENVRMILPN